MTGIQASTRDAVEAIGQIAGTVEEIKRFTAVIATTVEEQGSATARSPAMSDLPPNAPGR